jgi:hypothetical protein
MAVTVTAANLRAPRAALSHGRVDARRALVSGLRGMGRGRPGDRRARRRAPRLIGRAGGDSVGLGTRDVPQGLDRRCGSAQPGWAPSRCRALFAGAAGGRRSARRIRGTVSARASVAAREPPSWEAHARRRQGRARCPAGTSEGHGVPAVAVIEPLAREDVEIFWLESRTARGPRVENPDPASGGPRSATGCRGASCSRRRADLARSAAALQAAHGRGTARRGVGRGPRIRPPRARARAARGRATLRGRLQARRRGG